jgi:uncharacterized protein (DUF305 family)
MTRPVLIAILAVTLVTPGVQAAEMKMPMKSHTHAQGFEAENDAAMADMMEAMAVKPSGNPDKDFARMMLAHHRGAVAMAKTELKYGKDSELRALSAGIVAAQEKEIAQMEAWLKAH